MYEDELIIGSNTAAVMRIVDEHNRLAAVLRAEQATIADEAGRFTDEYWKSTPRVVGHLATGRERYYLAPKD